jgi:Alpha amylase, catalytic domain
MIPGGIIPLWGARSSRNRGAASFRYKGRHHPGIEGRLPQESAEMVARFHEEGLEIILDVVYNHSAEGNELGPTLSFKGIDNANYYRLLPDQKRYYIKCTVRR